MRPIANALFTLTLIAASTAANAAGRLDWQQTEYSIEVSPGQKDVSVDYTFTNRSEEDIFIERVRSSCGCTVASLQRKRIPSGETGRITATFNVGRRRGLNRTNLDVYLREASEPVAHLQLTVDIPNPVLAKPALVYWKADEAITPKSVRVELDKRYVERIERVEYDEASYAVDWTLEADRGKSLVYTLRVTPLAQAGQSRSVITIHATGAEHADSTRIYAYTRSREPAAEPVPIRQPGLDAASKP